jgi:DNA-binding GntR family transcriptional regulator
MVGLNSAESAYLHIRSLLVQRAFQPGARLSEPQLSDRLGISRTPVREALRRLQSDGLVTRSSRGGVVVARLGPAESKHAYQLRGVLEALTAELAAERQQRGELAPSALRELQERARIVEKRAAEGDLPGTTDANLRLHQWIAELGGNPLVVEALGRIWDRMAISSLSNFAQPGWFAEVTDHHRAIVAAVVAGQPAEAARIAAHHVARAATVYSDHDDSDRSTE